MSGHLPSPSARRQALIAQIKSQTGIDEALIERLVRGFYLRIQADPVLGPIFATRINDWEPHLQKMIAFWSSVTLMSGRYHGQPMAKHLALPVEAEHFDRWLELFQDSATRICPPAAAARFIDRSRRIADSLELGIAASKGEIKASRGQTPGVQRQ